MLNDLYFKTTCNIKPHLLGPMGGLKIEGPLYTWYKILGSQNGAGHSAILAVAYYQSYIIQCKAQLYTYDALIQIQTSQRHSATFCDKRYQ